MNRIGYKRFLIGVFFCLGLAASVQAERCGQCGGELSRQRWTYSGKTLCSEACVDQLRPVCSVCAKRIRGRYTLSNGRIFCSTACFHTTLPACELCQKPVEQGFSVSRHHYCSDCMASQPTCFSCGLPAGGATHLADGRAICSRCMRRAVVSREIALHHFERARQEFEAWTSLKLKTVPELVLVDRNEMQRLSRQSLKTDSSVSIRGLYSRQIVRTKLGPFGAWKEDPSKTQEKIYIVDYLDEEVFRVAATHELMHDLIHEVFPHLEKGPLWMQEGICQQVAAELCRRNNYSDILYGIETSPDPDYGDGYRYIRNREGLDGWHALRQWMESVDVPALPATP